MSIVTPTDLGCNDLGCKQVEHGFAEPSTLTPTIDALAASGVRLNKYYVDTPGSSKRGEF